MGLKYIRRLMLLVLVLAAFFWKREVLFGGKREDLISPTVGTTTAEKVLAGNDEKREKEKIKVAKLERLLSTFTGTYGVYVENLKEGLWYGVRVGETFPAASQMKLPVILAAYLESEKGRLNLDDRYILQESDKVEWTTLASVSAGSAWSYRQLIELAARNSDSSAIGILVRKLGVEKINETLVAAGMKDSSFDGDATTPRDVGIFFSNLQRGMLLRREYQEELLGFLTGTIFEDRIPVGIPSGTRIAHKVGTEDGGYSDGGVVFGKEPIVLVVMSREADLNEAPSAISKVAKMVWEFEESI